MNYYCLYGLYANPLMWCKYSYDLSGGLGSVILDIDQRPEENILVLKHLF